MAFAGLAALGLALSACSDGGDDAGATVNQTAKPPVHAAPNATSQANAVGVKPKGPYSDANLTAPPDATKGGVFGPDYAPDANTTAGGNQTPPQR